ncbi:putative chitinase 3, partial [Nephila pilipes]
SLGGWADSSKKYSELVESQDRIDNFVNKVVPFLKAHGFDGLDVAWEYPNCWQGALGVSPKDKDNYVTFLQRLNLLLINREFSNRDNRMICILNLEVCCPR